MQHVAAFAAFQIERDRFLADVGADEIRTPPFVGDQRADIAVGIAGQGAFRLRRRLEFYHPPAEMDEAQCRRRQRQGLLHG